MPRFTSLRWRLVASYVLLTGLTVGVLVLLATTLLRQYVERQENDALRANAEAIAKQVVPLMRNDIRRADRSIELDQLARTAAFLSNTRVNILNTEMQSIVDSGRPPDDQVIMLVTPGFDLSSADPMRFLTLRVFDEAMQREMQLDQLPPGSKFMTARRVSTPFGNRLFFEAISDPSRLQFANNPPSPETGILRMADVAVQMPDTNTTVGYVQVSSRRDISSDTLQPITQNLAIAGGIAAALAAVLGLLVSAGLTRPVQRLTLTAQRISQGDLSARTQLALAHQPHDEIAQLAGQFDQMATQLQTSFGELAAERDALRRFIADASHELRTPITALRMYNELLQGQASDNVETRQEFLIATQQQLARLQWITQNLLDLSRLDAGLIKLNLVEVDASELARNIVAPLMATAQQKQVTLATQVPVSARVRCDAARMEMALSNLIDNAIKFTPSGGQVTLGVQILSQQAQFTVMDTGIGIPSVDLPHIFDRFYRGQNENLAPGNGLGLSIVQSIVQAHGGQVSVRSTQGTGTCFTLVIPNS